MTGLRLTPEWAAFLAEDGARALEYLARAKDPHGLFTPDTADVAEEASAIVTRAASDPDFAPILAALAVALCAADRAMDDAEASRHGI